MKFKMVFLISTVLYSLSGCSNAVNDFKNTSTGKALFQCVAGSGDLVIKPINLDNGVTGVDVHFKKSETINMQFAVDKNLNQAKLIGANIEGKDKLTKFALMLSLEINCGGSLSSQILPDEYNTLRLIP